MSNFTIKFAAKAEKQARKLPVSVLKKLRKKLQILIKAQNHPSLNFHKKASSDQYEGRIDIHYRFSGKFIDEDFYITSIGMHDVGLGRK